MDGVVQLLGLLDNNHSDNVRLAAVGALLNLAVEDECKTSIRSADGITKLVPMLSGTLPLSLRAVAAMTLTNLAVQESSAPAIANVLGTLLSLAETQENRFAIAEAGAVGLLIRQLESSHRAVVEKAAGVIWNLAHEDSVRTTIRQP